MFWINVMRSTAAAIVIAFASPASAQFLPDGYAQSMIDSTAMGVVMEQAAKQGTTPVSSRTFTSEDTDPQDAALASFRYTPSKARTRANLARFVSKTRAVNPAEANRLQSFFASTDVIGAVGTEMRKAGLNPNDVADAYAVWWTLAWYAVQGRESQSDPDTLAAVRQQAARAFAATGKFGSASDTLRQEMAESLMVQAAMADAANDQMRGDPNQRRALATAVNKGARGMGLDLTSMTLTKEGFQPRKRSDAGEAIGDVEGAEPEALAASSVAGASANDTDDRTGTYTLIAAAGGAGLAGMFMVGRAAGRKG